MKLNFPFIQIAGVNSEKELKMLLNFENLYIGFPFFLDYNKEDTSIDFAKELIEKYKLNNQSILITYLNEAQKIKEILNFLNINIVQIHSEINIQELELLKMNNNFLIIKSLIIGKYDINELKKLIEIQSPCVDAFITDTYNPATGASGATGLTHDWNISKEIIEFSEKPVIIAGGLNPENIHQAIEFCSPFGVDSHTGVEDENGNKNHQKVKSFYDISMNSFKNRL